MPVMGHFMTGRSVVCHPRHKPIRDWLSDHLSDACATGQFIVRLRKVEHGPLNTLQELDTCVVVFVSSILYLTTWVAK